MKTAVEWLEQKIKEYAIDLDILNYVEQAKEKQNQMLINLVQQLKDYTREAQCILGNDEREASEFVDIFLKQQEQ